MFSHSLIKIFVYSKMEVPKEEPKAEPVPIRTPFNLHNLPTTIKGLVAGDVWNNGGVLNIVSK
tara:strand:- start:97 stop:285 length:189 start_codon:yes stop_codon:yes gene_type:complete